MKNVKNLKLKAAISLIISGFLCMSVPAISYAEDEVIYEQEKDDHKEESVTDTQDTSNNNTSDTTNTTDGTVEKTETPETKVENVITTDTEEKTDTPETKAEDAETIETKAEDTETIETKVEGTDTKEITKDDILYEQTTDDYTEESPKEETSQTEKTEYGSDEFIDGDNYDPDKDASDNPGDYIPDSTPTEAERKGLKQNPPSSKSSSSSSSSTTTTVVVQETPIPVIIPIVPPVIPETPPAPKTGDDYTKYILFAPSVAAFLYAAYCIGIIIFDTFRKTVYVDVEDNLTEEPQRVVGSRRKKSIFGKTKRLK